MLLRPVQSPARRIVGCLAARARISSVSRPRLQAAGRPFNTIGRDSGALLERPTKKPLSYWSIAVAGVLMGTLAGCYERVSKAQRGLLSVLEAMPARPPEMEPSQIIDAMIDLQEDSDAAKDIVQFASLYGRYMPDPPHSSDPISISLYLAICMSVLHSQLFPTRTFETCFDEIFSEVPPISPVSWLPLARAVIVAQDPIAMELLLQAEAEIQTIRASACMDIFNLFQSDEVKTGRMKPIDVVKAMIEPLQKARFNALSRIFTPVYERLAVVREERVARAERVKGQSEENGRGRSVLG